MSKNHVVLLLAALALVGCGGGHARMVRREAGGGELALEGDRERALWDARAQMRSHCPEGYRVVSEHEAVVGEQARVTSDYVSVKETRTNLREQRVAYRCARQPAQASGTSAAPAPQAPPLASGRGGISVRADVEPAEIWLDGERTGQAAPTHLVNLRPGVHEVEVRSETHVGRAKVEVVEGAVTPVRVALTEPRRVAVTVDSSPSGAELELDGRPIGRGPVQLSDVPAGPHRLRAEHPDHPSYEEDVELTAGAATIQLPPQQRSQFRVFPVPLLLEYDFRVSGGSWLGLQLNLGPTLPTRSLGVVGTSGSAMFVYRWQTPVHRPLGFSAVAGVGVGVHDARGDGVPGERAAFVGFQALAGAEVRYAFISAGLDVLYLTPASFNGNDDAFFRDSPFVLVPKVGLVFAF